MSAVTDLHAAVRQGNLPALRTLLAEHPRLANARSETDPRGTYPLLDSENDAIDDWRRCVELLRA